jgi:lactate dehydrogenase-like 2-hydroxyacid dehydrogenase
VRLLAFSRGEERNADGVEHRGLPHIGSATTTARDAMARLCAENVIAVIEGREPSAPVV